MHPSDLRTDREVVEWAVSTPTQAHETEWVWLVQDFLKLEAAYLPAVQETLRQGRWRQARNAKAYVITVARREAARLGWEKDPTKDRLVPIPTLTNSSGREVSTSDAIDYLFYDDGPRKRNNRWKAHSPSQDPRDYNESGERITRLERLTSWIPARFNKISVLSPREKELFEKLGLSTDPQIVIDWDELGIEAGLDEGERKVLNYKIWGYPRQEALAAQETEKERKALQAAYRRFDRGGIDKVRQLLRRIGRDRH